MNMDGIKKKVAKAKADVNQGIDDGAADLKKAREDGEQSMKDAHDEADKKIDDSKLKDPIKKAAKSANDAAYKAAVKAVDKAKNAAKDAVEKAHAKAKDIVADLEKQAKEAVDKAEKYVNGVVDAVTKDLKDVIDDSSLPGPMKEFAKQGVDELNKLAKKGVKDLANEADKIIAAGKKEADAMLDKLKDKALDILGFKPADPAPASTTTPATPKPQTTSRAHDHQGAFRFSVQLGGVQAGTFTAVDGLQGSVEMLEYQGGMDMYARQIPGRPKVAPVVLKKGYVNTAVLWDWMKSTMDGDLRFENVTITLLADDGVTELGYYNLLETWPSRWSGWQLDANGSNAMMEELELQVRTVERKA